MAKITLEDLLNKTPQEVLKKMRGAEDLNTSSSTKEISTAKETLPEKASKSSIDRKQYVGLFKTFSTYAKGQVLQLADHTLTIINLERSSGRVRFSHSSGEVFSLPLVTLLGQEEECPYRKGDIVVFEGNEYVVVGLNPASKNIVITFQGKPRYVKYSKVRSKSDESNSIENNIDRSDPVLSQENDNVASGDEVPES